MWPELAGMARMGERSFHIESGVAVHRQCCLVGSCEVCVPCGAGIGRTVGTDQSRAGMIQTVSGSRSLSVELGRGSLLPYRFSQTYYLVHRALRRRRGSCR